MVLRTTEPLSEVFAFFHCVIANIKETRHTGVLDGYRLR